MRRADNGLLYVPAGMGAARLHAIHARAPAAGGDAVAARAAMTTAEKARADADADRDELHDGVGSEFAFDAAKLWYHQALALLDSGDPAEAEQAAAEAIALYEAVPVRDRSYGCAALARIQLTKAALMGNRLETCRQLLRVLCYRGSDTAQALEQKLAAAHSARTAGRAVMQILERLRAGESPVAIARQTGAIRERGPGPHLTRDGVRRHDRASGRLGT